MQVQDELIRHMYNIKHAGTRYYTEFHVLITWHEYIKVTLEPCITSLASHNPHYLIQMNYILVWDYV